MSDQNPYGPPPQPGYPATPPPAAPGYGGVPPQAPPPGYPAPGGPEAGGYPGYPGTPEGAPGAYPGYGGYAPVPPRKSRRTLWIVLGTVGAVLVVLIGVFGYLAWNVTSGTGTEKLVMPATFKDLKANDDPAVTGKLQDELTSKIGQGDGNWKPTGVAGVYQDADSTPQLIAVGVYGKVLLPKQELDQMFAGFSGAGGTISGRHAVDPGPKGGQMECATSQSGESKLALCAWADKSTVVMVLKGSDDGTQPDIDKLAADTRDLRAVAEVPK
ncbi:hypothetical protein ACFXPX_17950 [Kitasatospora sp. NPDC059146]|uniref:hypothetical protein n=1 Tax=unclassified Kitasatospora TaxID=2633591 RepID=UPI00368D66B4